MVRVEYSGQRMLTAEERKAHTGHGTPDWVKVLRETVGSGFFVNDRGDIVTNHHVVTEDDLATRQIVVIVDGEWRYPARVHRSDKASDLAVIRIELEKGTRLNTLRLRPRPLEEGDAVVTDGHPGGGPLTRSRGKVVAAGRLVECNIPARIGNSGGPVLDERGGVVGVVTALRTRVWTSPRATVKTDFCLVVPTATLRKKLDAWQVSYQLAR
ncbi:MAG: S1 family peptidase [Planctomycetota bacterium]